MGSQNSACNSVNSTYWTLTHLANNCDTNLRAALPLNFALANCSFARDEAQTGSSVYTARLSVSASLFGVWCLMWCVVMLLCCKGIVRSLFDETC